MVLNQASLHHDCSALNGRNNGRSRDQSKNVSQSDDLLRSSVDFFPHATSITLDSMDAGVSGRSPQILFSTPDGNLTYGLNGQFQLSPGSSMSGESSAPSLTRDPQSAVTTTTGSVKELFSSSTTVLSTSPGASTSKLVSFSSRSRSSSVSSTSPRSSICEGGRFGYPCSNSVSSTSGSISIVPLRTVTPVVPAKVSSSVEPSPWYLAVIFGSIAGTAVLIAFVVIIVMSCIKAGRRRRAQNTDIPWAGDEEGRLFFDSRNVNCYSANALGKQRTSPFGRLPSSFSSVNRAGYSLHDHPIPGSHLFSEDSLPPTSEEPTLARQPRPTKTLRLLPSHLIDEELAARAVQEDGAYSCFPGRPVRLRKRSHGQLDDNPYINPPSESLNQIKDDPTPGLARQPLADRLRNLGKQDKEHPAFWDRLPTPGRDQPKVDIEPWAASFKANLLNAFNTFAAGLKSRDSFGEDDPDRDRLTHMPTRRRLSSRSSYKYPFLRRATTKSLPVPLLDGGGVCATPDAEKGSFQRTGRLLSPSAPFLPSIAKVHPRRDKDLPTRRNPISRDSSFYSTSSLTTSTFDSPEPLSRRSTGIPIVNRNSSPDVDVIVLEPEFVSFRRPSR